MKYQAIREEVKRLSDLQISLKPQRKTVHFHGKRTVADAAYEVDRNRYVLRHLFIAYAIIRKVERPLPVRKTVNKKLVDQFVLKYAPKEEDKVA